MNSEVTNNKERSRRRFLKESVALAGMAVGVAQPGSSQTRGRVTSLGPVRRVVTGKNAEGKSTVIFDGPAPTTFLNGTQQMIWVTDSTPADNSGNRDATLGLTQSSLMPNSTGSVFRIMTFPVGFGLHCKGACTDASDLEGRPGNVMHHTKTIDYMVILSGEIDLLMSDGSEVRMKPGDVLVQRGVVHRWINRGKELCRAAFVIIGAKEIQP